MEPHFLGPSLLDPLATILEKVLLPCKVLPEIEACAFTSNGILHSVAFPGLCPAWHYYFFIFPFQGTHLSPFPSTTDPQLNLLKEPKLSECKTQAISKTKASSEANCSKDQTVFLEWVGQRELKMQE